MSPSEIEELFERYPDSPIRFTLASGDVIHIPNSRAALIDVLSLWIFRFENEAGRRLAERSKLVSIPNIVLAEPVAKLPPENPRRRRR
jgi:hypothetical protein